jgi:hypothetical protein
MEEIRLHKTTADALIENSTKKQLAETARLLAITLAYLQHGKTAPDLYVINNLIYKSFVSEDEKSLISEGIDKLATVLTFVHGTPLSTQFSQNIFEQKFIDMAEVFASGCEHIIQKYKPHQYIQARDHLISLVSDEKAKKTYASWWAPFKRAWLRGEGEKFILIVRKNSVAEHGKLAGKTGVKAALSEYVAGTGKK